jgi:hypothetical protein
VLFNQQSPLLVFINYATLALLELKSVVPALARLLVLSGIHLLQVTTVQPVQQTVNLQSALLNRVDHGRNTSQVVHTLLHVQPRERVLLIRVAQAVECLGILLADLAHRLEPDVEDVQLVVGQSGFHASAGSVAAEDDVLDLEVLDAELDGRQQGDVGRVDDVGDVAQHEDLAGLLAQHGGLGDARVATANPQDVGRLALGAVLEELGVFGGDVRGPDLVGLEGGGELVFYMAGAGVSGE